MIRRRAAERRKARTEFKTMGGRIERLEDLLLDIAMIADGHKSSTLCIGGENAALVNIRNMAAGAIGLGGRLRETGTVFRTGSFSDPD